ncbi:unnamed protein product, partial [Cladocopium goreaui]
LGFDSGMAAAKQKPQTTAAAASCLEHISRAMRRSREGRTSTEECDEKMRRKQEHRREINSQAQVCDIDNIMSADTIGTARDNASKQHEMWSTQAEGTCFVKELDMPEQILMQLGKTPPAVLGAGDLSRQGESCAIPPIKTRSLVSEDEEESLKAKEVNSKVAEFHSDDTSAGFEDYVDFTMEVISLISFVDTCYTWTRTECNCNLSALLTAQNPKKLSKAKVFGIKWSFSMMLFVRADARAKTSANHVIDRILKTEAFRSLALQIHPDKSTDPRAPEVRQVPVVPDNGGWVSVVRKKALALKDVLEVDACGHFDEDGLDVPPFVYGGGLFPKEPPVEEIFAAEDETIACAAVQEDGANAGSAFGPAVMDGSFQASCAFQNLEALPRLPLSIDQVQNLGQGFSPKVCVVAMLVDVGWELAES